jgi:hypothetical protein
VGRGETGSMETEQEMGSYRTEKGAFCSHQGERQAEGNPIQSLGTVCRNKSPASLEASACEALEGTRAL